MLSDDPQVVRAAGDIGVDLTVVCGAGQRDFGMVAIPDGTRQVFVQDSVGLESVLFGLYRAGVDPAGFDAIYSTDEGGVVTAAALGHSFGVRAIEPRVAALFRDKSLAKAALRAAGIEAADFRVIEDIVEFPDDYALPFRPAVLKPVAGGATYRTYVVHTEAELRAVVARERDDKRHRAYILEEFMPGDEWHVDGVMFGGELRFVSVGSYQKTCLTTLAENDWLRTFSFDPVHDADVYERVTPLAERVLRTLGLDSGVFHMELFHDRESGRLAFGECAARRGGGLIEEQVFRKFGVSLAEAALRCALGVAPVIEPVRRPEAVGSVYLPYTSGVLLATPSAEDLIALPNVEYALVEWPIGFTTPMMKSTINKVGQVLLTAGSRAELLRRATEIVGWFAERTIIVPPKATARQLREWYARVAPDGGRAAAAWKNGSRVG
ncbi:MAG TPA: ATP-grasp domain-containing protein [Mycobacteriales bacterium]|nr:ATP-grasp domain-containing protein [Mycobacteriales bacterium]